MLIIGHHRSGTSALAGSFYFLGASLGVSPGLKPDWSNPKGHFETDWGSKLNEQILNTLGSSWHAIKPFKKNWINSKKIKNLRSKLKANIKSDLKADPKPLYIIKDPRINILFPIYKQVLTELNIKPKIIFSQRNQQEIIFSIKRRNNFSETKIRKIIKDYEYYAKKHLKNRKVVYSTSLEGLSYKPKNYLNNLIDDLNLPINVGQTSFKEVENFLDFKLRNFHQVVPSKVYKIDFNKKRLTSLKTLISKQRTIKSKTLANLVLEITMPKNKAKKTKVKNYLSQIDGTPTRSGIIKINYQGSILAFINRFIKR